MANVNDGESVLPSGGDGFLLTAFQIRFDFAFCKITPFCIGISRRNYQLTPSNGPILSWFNLRAPAGNYTLLLPLEWGGFICCGFGLRDQHLIG